MAAPFYGKKVFWYNGSDTDPNGSGGLDDYLDQDHNNDVPIFTDDPVKPKKKVKIVGSDTTTTDRGPGVVYSPKDDVYIAGGGPKVIDWERDPRLDGPVVYGDKYVTIPTKGGGGVVVKKTDDPVLGPPLVLPPDVIVPPNPCLNLHDYGHVMWDYGFQWSEEVVNFVASPSVTKIAAFDDVSMKAVTAVSSRSLPTGRRYKVTCTGYYLRDFLCDIAGVSYSTLSALNVSVAKFSIPKLGGEYYVSGNGKLCILDVVPEGPSSPEIGDEKQPVPPTPPVPPTKPPMGSGQIYGTIYSDDIINDIREVCTKELWCRGTSSLQNHFRDVTSSLDDVDFIMDVYDKDLNDECKCYNYRILYGDYSGGGAIDLGGLDNQTMTKAIYGMYAKTLLPHQQEKFVIDGTEEDYVYIVDVRRARYGTAMDPGNWELNLGRISSSIVPGTSVSSSITFTSWASSGSFIDGSKPSGSVHLTNKVYQVVQGTLEDGITASGSVVGEFYPNHGTIVLAGSKMDSLFNFNTNRNVQSHGLNPLRLFTSISGSSAPDRYTDTSGDPIGFRGRKLIINHSKYVFVRVKNQLFNFSNNPTFVTGSTGEIIDSLRLSEKAWITSVGLYNPQKELLAIAKLPRPYLKSSTEEALFTIKVGQACCR